MRITKINIPKEEYNGDGLDCIKMDRLSEVVIIAGKNGAGKTRIVNKIFHNYTNKKPKHLIDSYHSQIEENENKCKRLNQRIDDCQHRLDKEIDHDTIRHIRNEINSYNLEMNQPKQNIISLEKSLIDDTIETVELQDVYSYVHFVPKQLTLQDCSNFSKKQMISLSTQMESVGVGNLPQCSFSKIQLILDNWVSATHQNSKLHESQKQVAIKNYEKLKELISIFLDTTLDRTTTDEATLFGFQLGESRLSDGQSILLQYCMAIYSQEIALKDLILVLDEPENHLHPSVIIEVIERIRKCVTNGQIWIITHSIPLLAHFDPSHIWYVENNKICHAGKTPEKVLNSLLGNEEEIAKLHDFLSLPAQYATSIYASECLLAPCTVITNPDDPQSYQIRKDLLEISSSSKLRVLDYGAGKGRIISNLAELDNIDQNRLLESIDYIAFDKYYNDKVYCEAAITKAYGNCDKRYFNEYDKLVSVYDKGSFDVIIMCNVLHEIDPKDWLTLFHNGGTISSLLSKNGMLLLIEDHQIPTGEKAYQNGFLVLDTPHLKDLFKITEGDNGFTFSDYRGDGRLKSHQIPKQYLIRIDANSRQEAIKSMKDTSREKILEIRAKETNYKNGKLHGFWTQQFANAQLVLSELTGSN